ncbi:ABC transporter ATP-binding protein [Hippea jasoniae]|uniref:ABC transporter ATP-binding protein n=1 Tax=Hippea jasoniae TaxID=944479 RepID=UPI00055078BB|nr:ABC transporter ATP-binding protein [Hippea jasoniae]
MLKIENLHVSYGSIKALRGVGVEVKKNSCTAIIGANGAGKTTLIKAIMGIVANQEGAIFFKNNDITKLPTFKRASLGIAVVPEGARVFGRLTVEENLKIGGYRLNSPLKFDYVYKLFPRLKERRFQLAGTLSGGERQMLSIARALMSKPDILLIDEVSLGLMPKLVDEVFDVIKELKNSGITIFLAEQNAHKAAEVADYLYVMELGRIIRKGKSDVLLNNEELRRAYLGLA